MGVGGVSGSESWDCDGGGGGTDRLGRGVDIGVRRRSAFGTLTGLCIMNGLLRMNGRLPG